MRKWFLGIILGACAIVGFFFFTRQNGDEYQYLRVLSVKESCKNNPPERLFGFKMPVEEVVQAIRGGGGSILRTSKSKKGAINAAYFKLSSGRIGLLVVQGQYCVAVFDEMDLHTGEFERPTPTEALRTTR